MGNKCLLGLLIGVVAGGLIAGAQIPARADNVARFNIVQGAVTVRGPGGVQAAAPNVPVVPGEFLSTGKGARAEIDLNGDTMLRLAGGVEAHYIDRNEIQLAQGTVEVSVLYGGYGATQIDTPSVTVRASSKGAYRVAIGADGTTYVTARRGHVEIVSPQRTLTIEAGTTIAATGPATQPAVTTVANVTNDAFDDFTADRDQSLLAQATSSPGDTSYPAWNDSTYYASPFIYPYVGVPLVAAGVCGYGYWGWGLTFGFGYAGGCGFYPSLALGYYGGFGYPYCCGYYGYNPYPYYPIQPPIVIINRGGNGGGKIGRHVGSVGSPRTPVPSRGGGTVVARAPVPSRPVESRPIVRTPIARTPIARAPVVKTPVARGPVERTPVARQRDVAQRPVVDKPIADKPVVDKPVVGKVDDPWKRFDSNRGTTTATTSAAANGAPVRDAKAWDHFSQTRGAISIKPEPITDSPHLTAIRESIGNGFDTTHTWNSVSTGATRPVYGGSSMGTMHSVAAPSHSMPSGGGAARGGGGGGGGSHGGGRP